MTVSSTYIANEEAIQRKPVELYHIWRDGGGDLYYTSGDVDVVFETNTYTPATIRRKAIERTSDLDTTTLTIQALNLDAPISDFFEINPVEVIWISVSKLHREQDPLEANVIFLGLIRDVAFSGVAAEIHCVGFEHFLNMPVPQWRFQKTCNHKIFDSNCGLDRASYKTTTIITLDATGTQLTSTDFGSQEDGYFTGGVVDFENEHRPIIAHTGDLITLAYRMKNLETNDTVDVYPGCDGRPETCRDKYNNIVHGLWFNYIPKENPVHRTGV